MLISNRWLALHLFGKHSGGVSVLLHPHNQHLLHDTAGSTLDMRDHFQQQDALAKHHLELWQLGLLHDDVEAESLGSNRRTGPTLRCSPRNAEQ